MANVPSITFILFPQTQHRLRLRIPIPRVTELLDVPSKYLLYLAGCITGVAGEVRFGDGSGGPESQRVPDNVVLVRDATYHYLDQYRGNLQHRVVIPQAFRSSSQGLTNDTEHDETFRRLMIKRDGLCVFTNAGPMSCQAAHLLAFKHQQFLNYIFRYRPIIGSLPLGDESDSDSDSVEGLASDTELEVELRGCNELPNPDNYSHEIDNINDIRNGVLINNGCHPHLYKQFAIIPTPNFALGVDDIHHHRPPIPPHALGRQAYPVGVSYTAHWLEAEPEYTFQTGLNRDAAFAPGIRSEHLPHFAVLYYMYGVTAIAKWGMKEDIKKLSNLLTPLTAGKIATAATQDPPAMGPSQFNHPKGLTSVKGGAGAGLGDDMDTFDIAEEVVSSLWALSPAVQRQVQLERRLLVNGVTDWQHKVTQSV